MIRLSYEVSLVCVVRFYFEAGTSSVGYADTFPKGEGGDLSRRCAPLSPKGKAFLSGGDAFCFRLQMSERKVF